MRFHSEAATEDWCPDCGLSTLLTRRYDPAVFQPPRVKACSWLENQLTSKYEVAIRRMVLRFHFSQAVKLTHCQCLRVNVIMRHSGRESRLISDTRQRKQ